VFDGWSSPAAAGAATAVDDGVIRYQLSDRSTTSTSSILLTFYRAYASTNHNIGAKV